MAWNEPVGALPTKIEGEQREGKFESWHAKICFAERLRLQISFFDCLFSFLASQCVPAQRKQYLSFRRMHMSEVWAQ
jgi:hypothetical protein